MKFKNAKLVFNTRNTIAIPNFGNVTNAEASIQIIPETEADLGTNNTIAIALYREENGRSTYVTRREIIVYSGDILNHAETASMKFTKTELKLDSKYRKYRLRITEHDFEGNSALIVETPYVTLANEEPVHSSVHTH